MSSSSAVLRRAAAGLGLVAIGLWSTGARAALGAGAESIRGEQVRLAATRQQSSQAGVQVQTLQWADGSSVRQYVGADGRVFAVAWSTRTKPRLDQLLGVHFAGYAEAASAEMRRRPGVRHSLVVNQGDLVVEASAHGNAHVGRAYLRSLLPAGRDGRAFF
jgi:hypothetical protein